MILSVLLLYWLRTRFWFRTILFLFELLMLLKLVHVLFLMLLELIHVLFCCFRTALFVLMIQWPDVQCTKILLQKKDLRFTVI